MKATAKTMTTQNVLIALERVIVDGLPDPVDGPIGDAGEAAD